VRRVTMLLLVLTTAACGQPFGRSRPGPSEPFPERSPCMDTSCKAYRYTYHRNGRAMYDSLSPVDALPLQRAAAALDSVTFATLAREVVDHGFFRLRSRYSTGTTGIREVTVRAVLADTVKTVVEEEAIGPTALHEVQSLLDSIGGELSWQVVQRSN
jgi:hypothetical protein